MIAGTPSRTAMLVAAHRADHQTLDGASIFTDPLAVKLIGADAGITTTADVAAASMRGYVRLILAARARGAEDAANASIERGVRQVVVLGAGLDSFAYRHKHGPDLRVFEVDFPATSAWKCERLSHAGIAIPAGVHHVAVDFETDDFTENLVAQGFNPGAPCVVLWMGVVYYLTLPALQATLGAIGAWPGGGRLVMDYLEPMGHATPAMQQNMQRVKKRVAAMGEQLITFLPRTDIAARLGVLGFATVSDTSLGDIARHYLAAAPIPANHDAARLVVADRLI